MWESLPIQRKGQTGPHLGTIHPNFPYQRYSDVRIAEWRYVPSETKQWAMSIWGEHFGTIRTPLSKRDLFAWIPGLAILAARKGHWVDDRQSKPMVSMSCQYVHPERRREGIAAKMILSLAYEASKRWSIDGFLFELQRVPKSLQKAPPVASFHYFWVPCIETDSRWIQLPTERIKHVLFGRPGFHVNNYNGCLGYQHSETGRCIVIDCNNDVLAYDSMTDLLSFGIHGSIGHFCRLFSPTGTVKVYMENVYLNPSSYFTHIQLV